MEGRLLKSTILTLDTETNGEGLPGLVASVEHLGYRAEVLGLAESRNSILFLAGDALELIEALSAGERDDAQAVAEEMAELAAAEDIDLYFGTPHHTNDWDEIDWLLVQSAAAAGGAS